MVLGSNTAASPPALPSSFQPSPLQGHPSSFLGMTTPNLLETYGIPKGIPAPVMNIFSQKPDLKTAPSSVYLLNLDPINPLKKGGSVPFSPVSTTPEKASTGDLSGKPTVKLGSKPVISKKALKLARPLTSSKLPDSMPVDSKPRLRLADLSKQSELAKGQPSSSNNSKMQHLDLSSSDIVVLENGQLLQVQVDDALPRQLEDADQLYSIKYSLNHDGHTGKRHMVVSDQYLKADSFLAKLISDTVYGQWVEIDGKPVLDMMMHLNDNPEGHGSWWERGSQKHVQLPEALKKELTHISGENRKDIFELYLDASLQSMAVAVKPLVNQIPELRDAKVQIRFLSSIPHLSETRALGTLEAQLQKPTHDERRPVARFASNIHMWHNSVAISTKAIRESFGAVMKPKSLTAMLKNPKTMLPAIALIVVAHFIQAYSGNGFGGGQK